MEHRWEEGKEKNQLKSKEKLQKLCHNSKILNSCLAALEENMKNEECC